MKNAVIVAPLALKGTIGPVAVARAMLAGVRDVVPEATVAALPVSDGGDGLLDAVVPRERRRDLVTVTGPLGAPVEAELGWLGDGAAIIESAAACGLRLVPKRQRAPLVSTTRGVGELVLAATRLGAQRVYVGLGGSATVDGGTGMARGLGWAFRDANGAPLPEGGGALGRLAAVEPGPALGSEVIGLADVSNPLLGPRGAAATFAPQKGADPAAVIQLERGLTALARWATSWGRGEVASRAGAGAAGGLGAGLCLFAGATLQPGAPWVLERVGFDRALEQARCVLTAEGAFDATSMAGKATGEIVRRAIAAGVPVGVIAGRADPGGPVPVFTPPAGERLDPDGIARLTARAVVALLGLPRP